MNSDKKLIISVCLFLQITILSSDKNTLVPVLNNQISPNGTLFEKTRLYYKETDLASDIIQLTEEINEFRHNPHYYAAAFSSMSPLYNVINCVANKTMHVTNVLQMTFSCVSSLIGLNRQFQNCNRQQKINNFIREKVKTEKTVVELSKKIVDKIKEEYGSKSRKQKLIESSSVLLSGASLTVTFILPDENEIINFLSKVFNGISLGLFFLGSMKDLIYELHCKKVDFDEFEKDLRDLLNLYQKKV